MGIYKNIIGEKIGRLLVLEDYKEYTNNRSMRKLKCRCDCGNTIIVYKQKVLGGATKSCGCLQKETRLSLGEKRKKGYGEAATNECFLSYKLCAKKRGYPFELTKEQFKQIVVQPCIYCGASLTQEKRIKGNNGTFKYTGIDRYDNDKGYTVENSVPCCGKCNRTKTNMDIEEFENHLKLILSRINVWKRTV